MGFINQRSHHWGAPSCSYPEKVVNKSDHPNRTSLGWMAMKSPIFGGIHQELWHLWGRIYLGIILHKMAILTRIIPGFWGTSKKTMILSWEHPFWPGLSQDFIQILVWKPMAPGCYDMLWPTAGASQLFPAVPSCCNRWLKLFSVISSGTSLQFAATQWRFVGL